VRPRREEREERERGEERREERRGERERREEQKRTFNRLAQTGDGGQDLVGQVPLKVQSQLAVAAVHVIRVVGALGGGRPCGQEERRRGGERERRGR